MFEQKYTEMFSQVTASEGLYGRVMTMKNERKRKRSSLGRIALAAALLALMAISVSASETVQKWFIDFFAGINGGELSQEQVEYIENNAQPIMDSQTQDGWTVELHSALRDDTTAYIIFHIEGPEDVDLTQWTDEAGNTVGQVLFGNSSMPGYLKDVPLYFDLHEHLWSGGWGETWQDDGDGLPYTTNLVFHLKPKVPKNEVDPFGGETVYHFRFEDIIWFWTDMEYEQELRNGKYAGQNGIRYTDEELARLRRWETLAEGVWEFEIAFSQLKYVPGESIELPE